MLRRFQNVQMYTNKVVVHLSLVSFAEPIFGPASRAPAGGLYLSETWNMHRDKFKKPFGKRKFLKDMRNYSFNSIQTRNTKTVCFSVVSEGPRVRS